MGLEDELEAHLEGRLRTSEQREAEALVGKARALFAELASVLAGRGVPTEPIERKPDKPQATLRNFLVGPRPERVADGWELLPRFYLDTQGGLWQDEYIPDDKLKPGQSLDLDSRPVNIDAWIKTFAASEPAAFRLGTGIILKKYDALGNVYLTLKHPIYGQGYHDLTEGPFKDMVLKIAARLLRQVS
ncbi:UNVERIFIED_ORG: hypothetical protein ABID57_003090 [Arthrobacter sp. UYEF1]